MNAPLGLPGKGPIQRFERREALVDVQASGRFSADGYALAAYQVTDDVDAAPPELDGVQKFQFLGWQRSPTITITQTDPLPLTIRSIKSKVAH